MMHRDIKPENILLHDGRVVLGDYGFAKFIIEEEKDQKKPHTGLGTPNYMSPQLIRQTSYSFKCDIWALGIVLYEMIFGKKPWNGATLYELLQNIETQPIVFPNQIPESVQDLIKGMLQLEESTRLDWESILKHPAFDKVNDKTTLIYKTSIKE